MQRSIFALALLSILHVSWVSAGTFDMKNYGAIGDGKVENSKAFLGAWNDTCNDPNISTTPTTLIIPSGNFLVNPLTFTGPCKPISIIIQISGNILAPPANDAIWNNGMIRWISFLNIKQLTVTGPGTIDGRGLSWLNIKNAPTQITFDGCNNLQLNGFNLKDGQRNHLAVNNCNDASISNLKITASENSHNTDGIDIANLANMNIDNCKIQTGDDCIAINSGTSNVNITSIDCGPGHGISIGSLGKDKSEGKVQQIHIRHSNFTRTTNGARIKTYEGGFGFAKGITFENLNLIDVKNPIIIDQHYCPNGDCLPNPGNSAVKVADIKFKGIHGTSATSVAISLNCSRFSPCERITLEDVQITSNDPKKPASSVCFNADLTSCATCTPTINCVNNGILLPGLDPNNDVFYY